MHTFNRPYAVVLSRPGRRLAGWTVGWRLALVAWALFFTIGGAVGAQTKAGTRSVFKDKNLERAVRRFIFAKRDNNQPIVAADLVDLSVIWARGMGIADLSGLEKCGNLASLDLAGNRISNLKPLGGLASLEYLDLATNRIRDLSPLANLRGLQYLALSHNRVRRLKPLAGLTNLTSLYLDSNRVRNLTPLFGLARLTSLYLDHNRIRSLAGIEALQRLWTLSLNGNRVSALAPLGALNGLYYLFLEDNRIRDLGPLIEMAGRDFKGEKRFAPFLKVYLKGNRFPRAQAARLEAVGPRVYP